MANAELQAQLAEDLRRTGLEPGDTVLARCAARSVAHRVRGLGEIIRDALLDCLGPDGTLIGLTFTANQPRWVRERRAVFTPLARTVSGGFASGMLAHAQCIRSSHPTNSIAAIGRNAQFLTQGHDRHAAPFSWMSRLIDLKGKQILIGCAGESPGFSTIHYSQEVLNLAGSSLMSGLSGCYIETGDGQFEWVPRKIIPGCSMGFWKFYSHYVRAGILITGRVGAAYSILASAGATYAVERELLAANPRAALCDRPDCISCAAWTYNKRAWPALAAHTVERAGRALTRRILQKWNGR
jgi:aminoglycoside 3-N-acetyltransferase